MRRSIFNFAVQLLLVVGVSAAFVTPTNACPMCKLANEDGKKESEANLRPRAYMYSILFMLSMPATITGCFSFAFYRAWKRGQEEQARIEEADSESDA